MEKYQYKGNIINEWDSDRLPRWMVQALKDKTLHWDNGELYLRMEWEDYVVHINDWIVKLDDGFITLVPQFLVDYVSFMKEETVEGD